MQFSIDVSQTFRNRQIWTMKKIKIWLLPFSVKQSLNISLFIFDLSFTTWFTNSSCNFNERFSRLFFYLVSLRAPNTFGSGAGLGIDFRAGLGVAIFCIALINNFAPFTKYLFPSGLLLLLIFFNSLGNWLSSSSATNVPCVYLLEKQ